MRVLFGTAGALGLGLFLFAQSTAAAEPAASGKRPTPDTSLAKEVDDYLQEAQGATDDPNNLRVFWKNGIKLETADGNFKLSIFGRLMNDWKWISSDDFDSEVTADGTLFRRVRLGVGGTVYKNTFFKVQLEFANGQGGSPDLKDVYVGLKKLPWGLTFWVGHAKEPFSLEELTSSKYISFIERAASTITFAPARNTGFHLRRTFESNRINLHLWFGRTTDNSTGADMEDGAYSFTTRFGAWFLEEEETHRIVHASVGFSYRDPPGGAVRFRARPEQGSGPRLIDTGIIAAADVILLNFELAAVWRSFHFQAEFYRADVSAPSGGENVDFSGWYFEIGWWLTGEVRSYDRKRFVFGRTKPKQNFHAGSGKSWGAIQLVFRYDSVDLTDGSIVGGEQDAFAFGVNWHWNPNTRVMFNIIFADIDDGDGGANNGDLEAFVTRFQFDF